jgi:hypothetical protein
MKVNCFSKSEENDNESSVDDIKISMFLPVLQNIVMFYLIKLYFEEQISN